MARTTEAKVIEVMDTSVTSSVITPLLAIANRMVTNVLGSSDLSSDTLADIETYLTAHLVAIGPERQTIEEDLDDVRMKYTGKFGLGLEATTYGQMVLTLDSTGLMQGASLKKARFKAIPQFPDDYTGSSS